MIILSIETSCDETAISIVSITGKSENPKIKVLSDALRSQAELHSQYGGVFPNLAKREHVKNLPILLSHALKKAGMLKNTKGSIPLSTLKKVETTLEREHGLFSELSLLLQNTKTPRIDAIAVTQGPGLEPALWTGINFAKALGILWDIPVIPVNHMEGHFLSVLLEKKAPIQYPALALLISGGHTELVYSKKPFHYQIVGKTRDDAVGEAYDKVARLLNLPYPGGPHIARLAKEYRSLKKEKMDREVGPLPRPMIHSHDLDFSFSGLKTAVLYEVKGKPISETYAREVAGEFEEAVKDVLIKKTAHAIETHGVKTLVVAGGVAQNSYLKTHLRKLSRTLKITSLFPTKKLSTDNSIMIAIAGYGVIQNSKKTPKNIVAKGNLSF